MTAKTEQKQPISDIKYLMLDDENDAHFSTVALDNAFKAALARMTGGISPAGLASLYFTWASHLALSPGKQAQLIEKAMKKVLKSACYAGSPVLNQFNVCIEPLPQDKRFSHPSWQNWPYNLIYQNFLLSQQWWHNATTNIDGLSAADERSIAFITRQILDHFSPSNVPMLNPEVTQKTIEQGGVNILNGIQNLMSDLHNNLNGQRPPGSEQFRPGIEVAKTPGKVIYQNHLIELIQYSPTTPQVNAEPVLIVPAWIMKYYILDLSEHNSMVKYLVDKGHTVFMISWRNPTADDRHLDMEDYRLKGVMAAIDAVSAIFPDTKMHTAGYCLGGTLLTIAVATMARDGDERVKSMTHFAAQVDFSEAGELMLFTDESEVSYLEKMLWDQGVLDGSQMACAFQILRSNDLIWSRIIHHYLLGEPETMNDLLAWNTDLTRMPYKMHSEYLRSMFLNNDLSSGRYYVQDKPIAISDIHIPIFSVGTEQDHVAPWHSVYKLHLTTDTESLTFVLTSGGHNAGIVSEPGHKHRHYRIATSHDQDHYVDPDTWVQITPQVEGSWWEAWHAWLEQHSSGKIDAVEVGSVKGYQGICDAPGTYIHQQ